MEVNRYGGALSSLTMIREEVLLNESSLTPEYWRATNTADLTSPFLHPRNPQESGGRRYGSPGVKSMTLNLSDDPGQGLLLI